MSGYGSIDTIVRLIFFKCHDEVIILQKFKKGHRKVTSLVSLDYSLSSPAMTIWRGDKFESFVVSSDKKIVKFENDDIKVTPILYPIWSSPQERYEGLADSFMEFLDEPPYVFAIESYSFGSKGLVFNIAEATQTMKFKIWQRYGIEMIPFTPSQVKKEFSGKGNAKKELMAESFKEKFGYYLHEKIGTKLTGSACDVIDSIAVNLCLQKMLQKN